MIRETRKISLYELLEAMRIIKKFKLQASKTHPNSRDIDDFIDKLVKFYIQD